MKVINDVICYRFSNIFADTAKNWKLAEFFLGSSHCHKQSPENVLKKMFVKILQNSYENTCAGVSFWIKLNKVAGCSSLNFTKFLMWMERGIPGILLVSNVSQMSLKVYLESSRTFTIELSFPLRWWRYIIRNTKFGFLSVKTRF